MLHFGIIIVLESLHAGPSATDMITHWSLDWDLVEAVGRSEIEGIVTARGLSALWGKRSDTCGIIKDQIK